MSVRYPSKNSTLMGAGMNAAHPAGATRYYALNSGNRANVEQDVRMPLSRGGTLKNLLCHAVAVAGAGEDFVYTIYVNTAPVALTVTIAGGAETDDSDLVNRIEVYAGDLVSMRLVSSGGAAAVYHSWCVELELR